jgi:uncharacterized protein (DUF1501 family)
MKRRDLLAALAATPLMTLGGRLFAAPQAGAKLLVVFLRGAYDATNLLVPTGSSFYYESRPNIAIARPGDNPASALALNADWGLHPALGKSMLPLFQSGQLAFVPFAGTDDLSRSHFETQDSIELGQALENRRDYQSGFLNRLVSVLAGPNAARSVAFTEQVPLSLRGTEQVPNIAFNTLGKGGLDARQSGVIAAMYKNTALGKQVEEGFAVKVDAQRAAAEALDAASGRAVSTRGFSLEARRIARLMKDRFDVGFVDIGGWDTHVGQGGATGYLADRFTELGDGLAGYAEEMGDAWPRSVVVVISEFGRTFRENGNRGTDHGHGTVYWVLGGAIQGGRILGEQQKLEAATLFQNRDYPVLNEYRKVFAGLFQQMYGLDAAQLDRIFAGVAPSKLGIV